MALLSNFPACTPAYMATSMAEKQDETHLSLLSLPPSSSMCFGKPPSRQTLPATEKQTLSFSLAAFGFPSHTHRTLRAKRNKLLQQHTEIRIRSLLITRVRAELFLCAPAGGGRTFGEVNLLYLHPSISLYLFFCLL